MPSGSCSSWFCERQRSVRLTSPPISSGRNSSLFSDTSICCSLRRLPISCNHSSVDVSQTDKRWSIYNLQTKYKWGMYHKLLLFLFKQKYEFKEAKIVYNLKFNIKYANVLFKSNILHFNTEKQNKTWIAGTSTFSFLFCNTRWQTWLNNIHMYSNFR